MGPGRYHLLRLVAAPAPAPPVELSERYYLLSALDVGGGGVGVGSQTRSSESEMGTGAACSQCGIFGTTHPAAGRQPLFRYSVHGTRDPAFRLCDGIPTGMSGKARALARLAGVWDCHNDQCVCVGLHAPAFPMDTASIGS